MVLKVKINGRLGDAFFMRSSRPGCCGKNPGKMQSMLTCLRELNRVPERGTKYILAPALLACIAQNAFNSLRFCGQQRVQVRV